MNFTEECARHMDKYVLVKKSVYIWVKHRFATTSLSGKDNPLTLSCKEKLLGAAVNKEGDGDIVLEQGRKNATVNSVLLIVNCLGKSHFIE